jgi:Sulfotransferase family
MSAVALAPKPDAAALLLAAERATGLCDFGDNWSRSSLDNVVAFLNGDAGLSPVRRAAAYQQLVDVLSGRLRLIEDRRRYPGIEREEIEAPLIVMGFGRSGTTFLHSLIAEDPGNRAPAYWEVARPSPPPSLARPDDPRIDAGHLDIKAWLDSIPGFITQHPYWDQGALALMECESFYVYNLSHHYPIQESQIPFGTKWAVDVEEQTRYEFHRSFLQQLQYGGPPRRWALKGVDHQFYLTGLRAVYHDARLVWAHRDPVQVMGSLLEVTHLLTEGTGGDTADRTAFAHAWLNRHRTNLDKAMGNPLSGDPAICHVRYPDLTADPISAVRLVYEHFDLPIAGEHEARMQSWLADPANQSDRHGKWTYSLEHYGVDPGYVSELFADYRERFGV